MPFHRMCDSPMLTCVAVPAVVTASTLVVRRAFEWLACADLTPGGFQQTRALCVSVPPSPKTSPFTQE